MVESVEFISDIVEFVKSVEFVMVELLFSRVEFVATVPLVSKGRAKVAWVEGLSGSQETNAIQGTGVED